MSEETKPAAMAAPEGAKKKRFVPLTITNEDLAKLEEEHEDLLVMRGPEMSPWLVVLRRPTRQESIGYKHHLKHKPETANEQLVRAMCVFPDPKKGDDFDRQFARWPFFVDGLCDATKFKDFVGITVEADLK